MFIIHLRVINKNKIILNHLKYKLLWFISSKKLFIKGEIEKLVYYLLASKKGLKLLFFSLEWRIKQTVRRTRL